MVRRGRLLLGLSIAALGGVMLLFGGMTWYVWQDSVEREEQRLERFARALGEDVEEAMVDARDMLDRFNGMDVERCSEPHLVAMQEAAMAKPWIRAIGYWQAAERLCGVGFIRGSELTPPRADRIYDSGVIAWWPGPQTEIGGLELFLMRYGRHDVAIDPRLLLNTGADKKMHAALWVEGLRLAARPADAQLPPPDEVPAGISISDDRERILSRFSLGTVLPIDIVASEPVTYFWERYLPTAATAGMILLLLVLIWLYTVYRYTRRQLSLGAELREAIAEGKLRVLYQPVINLANGNCVGAEALVRWRREGGTLVSPDIFIPVAEKAGLISDITRVVLRSILRDLGKLLQEEPNLQVNLNLAREDLEQEDLIEIFGEELANAQVPPRSIKLEITERALINSDAARRQIRELRGRGHAVAIDDFGTGYSSLAYLETFEIDTLKIDKSFVDAIEKEAVTSNVIGHVIEMAHSLELDTVAEGIEQEHQVEWLREQGVTHGQGFLYSKPLTARRFIRYYRREARRFRNPEDRD
ncbi:MAG: EAL domain-containing protein [Gammaproteobacteria bacterium]|nr:EAL domain-containing protein [Gammaproteobacteria bacterium]